MAGLCPVPTGGAPVAPRRNIGCHWRAASAAPQQDQPPTTRPQAIRESGVDLPRHSLEAQQPPVAARRQIHKSLAAEFAMEHLCPLPTGGAPVAPSENRAPFSPGTPG